MGRKHQPRARAAVAAMVAAAATRPHNGAAGAVEVRPPLRAALPQLLASGPQKPLANPTRKAEPGVLGGAAEQVQLLRP